MWKLQVSKPLKTSMRAAVGDGEQFLGKSLDRKAGAKWNG